MDWANERYVRLYTRDTATWKLLDWRARTVLLHIIRKVDRAGVLDVGDDGIEGLAAVIELPLDIVEGGIEQLTRPGSRGRQPTIVETGAAYLLPNFIEAQETSQSDPQRKRESRARRRDLELYKSRFVTGAAGPLALPPGEAEESGIEDLSQPSEIDPPPSRFVTPPVGSVAKPGRPVTSGHSEPVPLPSQEDSLARARAIPQYVPGTVQLLDRLWAYQREKHAACKRAGIEPGTPDLWPQPPDTVQRDMLACIKAARGAGVAELDIETKGRHRIDVTAAEAERDRSLKYFKSMLLWNVESFIRACETSVAEARAPKRPRAAAAESATLRVANAPANEADSPPPIPSFHTRSVGR